MTRLFLRSFLMLALTSVLFVKCTCKEDEEPDPDPAVLTLVEKLSQAWELDCLTMNGTEVATTGFEVTLNHTDGSATTYTITTTADIPNPAASTSGSWSVTAGDSGITFDGGSANERTVSFVGTPTESSLKFSFIDTSNKDEPQYQFELVPCQ